MRQRKAPVAAASLMAGLALFATACTGGAGEVKDAGGGSDTSGKGKQADAMYKMRKCLRDHGVQVEEPKAGQGSGDINISGKPDEAKMNKAFKACQGSGPGAGKGGPSQADKDKMLKWAKCLREHGVNVADPTSDGAIQLPQGDKQKFDKANKACGGPNAG
ncbi:hypothetical protein YWIDRAFT_08262 [Streptomyces sp. SceaMP-e96]|uniref:hypothetical protein n=1 Tax=Streptomyces TaxID=1883 RepID=UPI000823DA0F|nr:MULTISPECIES: hypothetical protein [unclassified Streptomyces]MYT18528.1 hypothetical protein [Streptomyces sp. SID4951]SCK57250.1 hypothetical protein YWIDRAFT_08262 [Streptomyces sp. SceaMP-e96]